MRYNQEFNQKLAEAPKTSMAIHKGREVDIYRSTTPILYREGEKHFIEIVVFGYDLVGSGDRSECFMKVPGSELYIELYSGGCSSGSGKTHRSIRNMVEEWLEPFLFDELLVKRNLEFFTTGEDALLKDSIDHWFMKKIAHINDPERTYRDSPEDFGIRHINSMLNSLYVPLPDRRIIAYAYETYNRNIIIVDQSASKFTYKGMRCWYGPRNNMKEVKIERFARYRDGGTTHFEFELDGETHKFFHPTRLGSGNGKVPTFDETEMYEIEEDEKRRNIARELGINLQPKLYKD